MFGALISLPVLALLISGAYLFIDLSKPKAWVFALSISVSQLTMIGLFAFLAFLLLQDQDVLLQHARDQHAEMISARHDQQVLLSRLSIDPEKTNNPIKRAILFGLQPNNAFFSRIEAADQSLKAVLEKRRQVFQETGISVINLPEEINQELVQRLLKQLGFHSYYAEPALEQEETTDSSTSTTATTRENTDFGTSELASPSLNFEHHLKGDSNITPPVQLEALSKGNLLYLGSKVTTEDAQIIALVLMRAGMELKNIRRFQTNDEKNARLVMVDYKAPYERRASKTAEWVTSRKRFK